MAEDLEEVSGEITADEDVAWVNPLAALPEARGDLETLRTYPGRPSAGSLTMDCEARRCTFRTELPRRFGDVGALPGQGLWANGAWLPVAEGAPVARWNATVEVPASATALLNGEVASGMVRWGGTADRLALAVLPRARTSVVPLDGGGQVTFIGAAAQRPNVQAQVRALVADWAWEPAPRLVVVSSRDRRMLATFGPQTVYLSDRAFRLSPGLSRFHWPAVRRALYGAGQTGRSTWDAAFRASVAAEGRAAPDIDKALGWAAWNPVIDALLTDGTLPFYADLFNEAHPDRTDPLLRLEGRRDPHAAARQSLDLLGEHAKALLGEASPAEMALQLGIPEAVVAGWAHREVAAQDYVVVQRPGAPTQVQRRGGEEAEPVVLRLNGADETLVLHPGETREVGETKRVQVDPERHLLESTRSNNSAPPRWRVVATGWVDDISPSQGNLDVWGSLVFRRQDDTHNLYLLGVEHDAQDLVSFDLGYVHTLGPLLSRRSRPHRVSVSIGPSVLDPAYRPTDDGAVVLGGGVGYTWDTRIDDTHAMNGHRLTLGLGAGALLGTEERWASAGVSWVQLLPLHPRHIVALRTKVGWASGDVEHRLLPLGGADALRALPEAESLGNERVLGNLEYRWAPMRGASLPGPLFWLSELQVAPGLEAGAVWRHGETSPGFGATLGLYGIADLLGARPTLVGLIGGLPIQGGTDPKPQVYLTFDHGF